LVDRLEETALFAGGYVSHDLTEGGKTIFQMMSQKNLKKAEAFKLSTSREEVLYNVAINYYNLLEAKVVTENLITSYKERAYQYEIAKAKYEVGAGEKFDVVRTDIEVQQAKVNLLIAFNQFGFNKIKLANSMGVEVFDDSEDGEKIYEIALVNQTDLMALEKEIASLKNERSEILCEFVPKADFYAQYSFQGTVSSGTYPNTQIGVNVEIPIGENLGVGTMTKVKAMDKQIQAKEYELEQAKRDLKEEILISHARSNEAAKKIELFSKQFESSTISTQIATGKYFEGEGILLDVIQAQTEKTRISVELSSARAEYNKSQIELLFESGLITIPAILKNYKP
jgi:outer membrane protein TolC